jgi:predicted XRE-type DNA-binding protein
VVKHLPGGFDENQYLGDIAIYTAGELKALGVVPRSIRLAMVRMDEVHLKLGLDREWWASARANMWKPESFGAFIERRLIERQLSQTELSAACGVSQPLISDYIHHKSEPKLFVARRIVAELGPYLVVNGG